jgi:hypothetical protein
MKTRILIFTLSIFSCAAVRSELKWEQTTLDLHPAVGEKAAVAHFKYENVGKAPVHFRSVKASCGCTTTQTQKEVVNPGEKGEIVATFNIGDRPPGQQSKQVTVLTDDPPPAQSTFTLTLNTMIPQALEIKPTMVSWQSGEEPKSKKVSVKATKGFPARNLTIKSNSQNFESKVEPGKTEGEWTIEVTPKDTSHPMGTALTLQTDYPKESPKSFNVNVVVMAPPQPPAMLRPPAATVPATKAATPPAIPATSPTSGIQR